MPQTRKEEQNGKEKNLEFYKLYAIAIVWRCTSSQSI